MQSKIFWAAGAVLVLCCYAGGALAHGYSGKRFFPATITTDDPFVADELSLPTVSTFHNAATKDDPATRESDVSADIAKRITRDLAVSFGGGWRYLRPSGAGATNGPVNYDASVKYQLLNVPEHELLVATGVGFEWGGSGLSRVKQDRQNTFTPTFFFGKGMGDLPDGAKWVKPAAVTGTIGFGIPTRGKSAKFDTDPDTGDITVSRDRNPTTLNWGFAFEYSLIYLQSFIEDIGLGAPFNRFIPVVELNMQMPLNHTDAGRRNTGTVNPGVIWAGTHFQIGVEAMVPINNGSGRGVGGIAQLHFYLDDLFPNSLGKPIFDTKLFGD